MIGWLVAELPYSFIYIYYVQCSYLFIYLFSLKLSQLSRSFPPSLHHQRGLAQATLSSLHLHNYNICMIDHPQYD